MDGAQQIVTPAFVSLLCICIVFVPMFFLGGVAALPVRAAGRSGHVRDGRGPSSCRARWCRPWRTICCASTPCTPHADGHGSRRRRAIRWCASSAASRRASSASAPAIATCWRWRCAHRAVFVVGFLGFVVASFAAGAVSRPQLLPVRRWRADPDARARPGRHARRGDARTSSPRSRRPSARSFRPMSSTRIVDNIGLPISGINMAYNNTGTIGPQDGDIQIRLKRRSPADRRTTSSTLREELPRAFPGTTFSFLPADIVSQILNFGAPAPIDVQIRGAEPGGELRLRQRAAARHPARFPASPMRASSSRSTHPSFNVDVDRTRAQYVGLTERDVDQQPGGQRSPAAPGRADLLAQSRQRRLLSDRDADAAIPDRLAERAEEHADHRAAATPSQIARRHRRHQPDGANAVVSHYNIQPVIEIYATPQGRDLGAVAADIQKCIARHRQGRAEGRAGRAAAARCRP